MTQITIPIPPGLPAPLPPFLTKTDCVQLLQHWNLGGKHYLSKLIAAGTLHFEPLPHGERGTVTKSKEIINFYLSLQ